MAGLLLHLLFFASGAAGLIYELVWVRQFGTVFGSTVYSVALVTALFMCGLGVGGYAAGRFADARFARDPRSPLRWYGVLELAIGALALALTLGLPHLAPLAAAIAHYTPDPDGFHRLSLSTSLLRYAVCALLLAPITLLMGATLTLLIRYVVGREIGSAGWRISLLYAANTAGAAFGCLLTDTALVPALGLLRTQLLAVGLNLLAGAGAFALARRAHAPVPSVPPAPRAEPAQHAAGGLTGPVVLTALALGLTGLASMGMQVVWFRSLISVTGAYRTVFSLLLFVILSGLWLGSLIGSAFERRLHRPLPIFALLVALFVVSTFAGLAVFEASQIEELHRALLKRPPATDFGWTLGLHWITLRPALLVVGLPILCLGAAFPLANAYVQRAAETVGRRAGALYLANTAGAVAGSLLGGFVLLPALGMQRATWVLAATALLAVAALLAAEWRSAAPAGRSRAGLAVIGASLVLPLLAVGLWARLPDDFLLRRSLSHLARGKLLALHEGVNETIAVTEERTYKVLYTNGHPMSGASPQSQRYMRAFAHVPLLMHEGARTAMVMCFGVGNTLHAALLHPLERVDLVDLSDDVLAHAHWFEDTNHGALRDPRVRVYVDDGRQHLRMAPPESYDLITGEPPPISHAGVVSLYTREFFALARSRLRPNGLISYWLPIHQVSAETALALVRGFVEVFPDSVLLSGGHAQLILLGRVGERPQIDPAQVRARLAALPAVAADMENVGLARPQDLFGSFVASSETMQRVSAAVPALTDDRPALEYGSYLSVREYTLPPELFDLRDAQVWCPSCLEPRRVAADDSLATYRIQLHVMGQLYAHPQFLTRRLGDIRQARIPAPSGELATAEVSRSLPLREVLSLGPAEFARARALLDAGQLAEGTRLLEEVTQLLPGDARVRAKLGDAYLAAGRADDACREFDRALAMSPELAEARSGASRCGAAAAAAPTS